MRTSILIAILGACSLMVHAGKTKVVEQPPFIHSSHPSFVINRVTLTDTATLLRCHYENEPSARFSIRSSMFLEDQKCRKVTVKCVSEFPLDSTVKLPESGQMDFTIQFPPLAADTQMFDLIEGRGASAFRIYGISCTKKMPIIPQSDERCSDDELSTQCFRADSVWLTGDFINYSRNGMPHLGCIGQASHRIAHFDRREAPQVFSIDDDGHFACGFAVDHPMWQWADLNRNRANPLVFFARPGDTLHVEIKDYGQETQSFTYRCTNARPAYSALMPLWGYAMNRQYEESDAAYLSADYIEKVQSAYESRSRLYDYLASKHHFAPFENRLFKNTLRMSRVLDYLTHHKVVFSKRWAQTSGLLSPYERPALYFTPAQMGFLHDVDWSDPTLAYTPYWDAFRQSWYQNTSLMPMIQEAVVKRGQKFSENEVQEMLSRQIATFLPNIASPLLADLVNALGTEWGRMPDVVKAESLLFKSDDQTVMTFLEPIVRQSPSTLTQLLFLDAEQQSIDALRVWYNQRNYLFEDFVENPDLSVIVIAEQNTDSIQAAQWHQRYLSGIPCIFLSTTKFVELCASFRIYDFPGDVTVRSDMELFRAPFQSSDERTFRSNLRNYQKLSKQRNEQKARSENTSAMIQFM